MARERLKLYWQEIRRKRKFRSELNNVMSGAVTRESPRLDLTSYFLTPIIAPFSPKEQQRAETKSEFQQARELSISNLLPWQVLIMAEFNSKVLLRFTDLKIYVQENPKSETIAKIQHLLQMETEGQIKIQQAEPYGEISIECIDPDQESTITVKDQSGRHYEFDWCGLSDPQKNKVIADIKSNKILCKTI
jgi:chromatin segregation and condensation protein Rec8/ScpA/Scc1 (kleisin family)